MHEEVPRFPMLEDLDSPELPAATGWEARRAELQAFAHPLLESQAFRRLRRITFLGALSPRYSHETRAVAAAFDGTRMDHSLGVASLALDVARQLELGERTQRYAVAWGLLHDIATWPLSHTSEPAFEERIGVSGRVLRAMIISGRAIEAAGGLLRIPAKYRLVSRLVDMDLDGDVLLELFEPTHAPADAEMAILWQVIHSPITPDTLEGIWRAGQVYDIEVPAPQRICGLLRRGRGEAMGCDGSGVIRDFWQAKAEVYRRHINHHRTVRWESECSFAIRNRLRARGLRRLDTCLELSEEDFVDTIRQFQQLWRQSFLPGMGVFRYKPPCEYIVGDDYRKVFGDTFRVGSLSKVLVRNVRKAEVHA